MAAGGFDEKSCLSVHLDLFKKYEQEDFKTFDDCLNMLKTIYKLKQLFNDDYRVDCLNHNRDNAMQRMRILWSPFKNSLDDLILCYRFAQ